MSAWFYLEFDSSYGAKPWFYLEFDHTYGVGIPPGSALATVQPSLLKAWSVPGNVQLQASALVCGDVRAAVGLTAIHSRGVPARGTCSVLASSIRAASASLQRNPSRVRSVRAKLEASCNT